MCGIAGIVDVERGLAIPQRDALLRMALVAVLSTQLVHHQLVKNPNQGQRSLELRTDIHRVDVNARGEELT